MPYEIPAEIAYEEKIIFGLTLRQLVYCLVFSPVVLAILFKAPYDIRVRVGLALIPAGICALFIYTPVMKWFLDWYRWLDWREFYLMDNHMKRMFRLDKIKDTAVRVSGRRLSVIRVEPINFSIRNKQEKDITIMAFQRFLNSLDFPVQIVIATDSINLDHYTSTQEMKAEDVARKTKNEQYTKLFKDYKAHLYSTVSKGSLVNRLFYLVVPESGRLGLGIQVDVCCDLLKNIGLRHKVLAGEELKQALAGFFNNLYTDDDKKPLMDEKECDENRLHYTVAPKCVINHMDCIQVGDKLARTIAVKGYPRIVEAGFLDKLITINGDFDLSMHIEPFEIERMMVTLNRELQKQRADLYAMQQKGIINPALEIKYKDTRSVMENIQMGSEKLFNISLYITCKGSSVKELDLLTKKVESELNALLMLSYRPRFLMHKGIKSTFPVAENELGVRRSVTTKALSAFFPFTSQFLQIDEDGIWLGLNGNNIPIIKDLFKLYNINGVILASSGGGKSYFTKLMISRLLLNGTKVMVVDPQSEYTDLVQRFNGQLVTISRTSNTIINPLDLMGHDFDEKKLTLMDLFPVMLGQTSEIQKAVLDRALTIIYASKTITNNPETWRNAPPMMGDLLNQLKKMSKTATKVESETYRSLINRIEMYVTGVFSFLNKQTNINFNNRFVCFNIGDMPNQVKPAVMFLILDYVYMKMRKDIERKILVIDEAWSLLERTEDESYIFRIVKTCRKFNMGLLLITQDVGDLLKNEAGKALLNNSEYTLLLRQKPAIIEQVETTFRLSQKEKEHLLTAKAGEGIIIISNEHSEIRIVASPEEHKIITTNADERLNKERENAKEPTTHYETPTPPAQQDKGFYKKANLSETEAKQLLEKGYIVSEHVGLFGGRREEYLLKPRHNESPEHFFTVKAIEEYLRQYTDKITLYETTKPDIVFEANGKKIAVEVETGKKFKKDNNKLLQKVASNNEEYGNCWFFVVINVKDDKERYGKLATTYARREVPNYVKDCFKQSGSQNNPDEKGTETTSQSPNSSSGVKSPESLEFGGNGSQNLPLNRAGTA